MKRWVLVGLSLLALYVLLPAVRGQQGPPAGPRPNGPPVPRPPTARFAPREVKLAVQVDESVPGCAAFAPPRGEDVIAY
jgi:hypothetical protein